MLNHNQSTEIEAPDFLDHHSVGARYRQGRIQVFQGEDTISLKPDQARDLINNLVGFLILDAETRAWYRGRDWANSRVPTSVEDL